MYNIFKFYNNVLVKSIDAISVFFLCLFYVFISTGFTKHYNFTET